MVLTLYRKEEDEEKVEEVGKEVSTGEDVIVSEYMIIVVYAGLILFIKMKEQTIENCGCTVKTFQWSFSCSWEEEEEESWISFIHSFIHSVCLKKLVLRNCNMEKMSWSMTYYLCTNYKLSSTNNYKLWNYKYKIPYPVTSTLCWYA